MQKKKKKEEGQSQVHSLAEVHFAREYFLSSMDDEIGRVNAAVDVSFSELLWLETVYKLYKLFVSSPLLVPAIRSLSSGFKPVFLQCRVYLDVDVDLRIFSRLVRTHFPGPFTGTCAGDLASFGSGQLFRLQSLRAALFLRDQW